MPIGRLFSPQSAAGLEAPLPPLLPSQFCLLSAIAPVRSVSTLTPENKHSAVFAMIFVSKTVVFVRKRPLLPFFRPLFRSKRPVETEMCRFCEKKAAFCFIALSPVSTVHRVKMCIFVRFRGLIAFLPAARKISMFYPRPARRVKFSCLGRSPLSSLTATTIAQSPTHNADVLEQMLKPASRDNGNLPCPPIHLSRMSAWPQAIQSRQPPHRA